MILEGCMCVCEWCEVFLRVAQATLGTVLSVLEENWGDA